MTGLPPSMVVKWKPPSDRPRRAGEGRTLQGDADSHRLFPLSRGDAVSGPGAELRPRTRVSESGLRNSRAAAHQLYATVVVKDPL